jgi:hypothetical protein
MDQTQNGEVIIGPQPDPNVSVQDADMEEDEARSEATFRYTVQQFSKLKVSALDAGARGLRVPPAGLRLVAALLRQKPTLEDNGDAPQQPWTRQDGTALARLLPPVQRRERVQFVVLLRRGRAANVVGQA